MDNTHFLHSIFKETNFNPKDLEKIISLYKPVSILKNSYFIEENSYANFYYFLESGFARSFAVDLEGNDITTNFFEKGDMLIDWQSYFLKTKSKENFQAITNCTAWKINFDDFMTLFNIEAFREIGRTNLITHFFEHKSHSVSFITDPAKERYLNFMQTKPNILHNVPMKQIATYLGITDTSLSRIRKEITDKQ